MLPWTVHGNGRTVEPGAVVRPEERLSWPATVAIGVQHVVAMFGATFLVPILTGFPVPTTLLFSGIGTIWARRSRPSGVSIMPAVIGVRMTPGPTAFNGMPAPAHSGVTDWVRTHSEIARLVDA